MKISNILFYASFASLLITGCKPRIGKEENLPAPAPASIAFDTVNTNTYVFHNTTPGGFISAWDFGVKKSSKASDTVFFAYKGDYTVKLTTSTPGGTATTTKVIHVLSTSPYAADFTFAKVDSNHVAVVATTPNPVKQVFHYANGDSATTTSDTVYLPWQGTYDIAYTAVTSKGPSTIVKKVVISQDDPSNPALTDPVFTYLTGGPTATNGKTWVMVSAPHSGGVGPYVTTTYYPDWYDQPSGFGGDAWDKGMLSNEFTFKLRQYQYIPKNQNITAHWAYANKYFGKNQAQYADIALVDPKHKQTPFILKKTNSGIGQGVAQGYTLDFTNGSYLGYFDNRYHHEIIRINADTLYIRHGYSDDPNSNPKDDGGVRYFTFVAKK